MRSDQETAPEQAPYSHVPLTFAVHYSVALLANANQSH